GKPVRLWLSDKQDAFVKGIKAEFPGVPHRYCQNHFLRDLAKPMLKADSHAKVQMRKKVRGLRAIEREALGQRQAARAQAQAGGAFTPSDPGPAPARAARGGGTAAARPSGRTAGRANRPGQQQASSPTAEDSVAQVVLDYCCVVRGILNDDQGGPLCPTGL